MNVVDLHPEDLIDKLEVGSLSVEEKARLEAHLRGCAECRFEVSVRADLADEALAPHARPAGPLAAPNAATRPSSAPRRSLPPRRALFFPAIAAALVAGGALAAVVSEVVRAGAEHAPLHRLEPRTHAAGRAQQGGHRRGASPRTGAAAGAAPGAEAAEFAEIEPPGAAPAPPEGEEHGVPKATTAGVETAASEETTAALAQPRASGQRSPGPDANRAGASSDGPRVRGAAPIPAALRANKTPEPAAEGEPRTAAALFGAANRARRYGDTAQAMALYHALQVGFPASEEARLSRATLATLELDRGDPGAALEGFDRYIEQGGSALSVEALVGRAVALSKLGKTSEELASWKEVARRFPGTVHAKRAAARIAVLSGR
jgi:TolA-binding protein